MRIEELYIEGFGHFSAKRIGPFDHSVSVIYGPNESGKSTLLAFIRTVLFGFPPRTTYYLPSSGEQHGGRITLVDGSGNRYVVERFRGPRGGRVSLSTGDGAPVDPAVLGGILGEASREVFQNVFAFSLDELQNSDSLNNSEVDSQIYGAGIGAANLPAAIKSIGGRKAAIFRNRGQNQIASTLADLNEVSGKLAEAQVNAAKYGDLVSKLSDLDRELKLKDLDLSKLNQQSGEIERLRQGWEDWVALAGIEDNLEALALIGTFPEDARSRLAGFLEREVRAKEELEEDEQRLAEAQKLAQVEIPGEELLDHLEVIEQIRRGRNEFDGSVRDLPERKAELQGFENVLLERVRALGTGWDETSLESFDTSISTQEQIEQSREIWTRNAETVRQRESHLDQAKEELREREFQKQVAQKSLDEKQAPRFDASELDKRRNALRAARTRLGEHQHCRQRHTNLRDQLGSMGGQSPDHGHAGALGSRNLPLTLGTIAIVIIAAGATLGTETLIIGEIAGAMLLAISAYLFAGRAMSGSAPPANEGMISRIRDAEVAEAVAEQELRREAESLGLGLPDAVGLDEAEAELDSTARSLAELETLSQRLKDANGAVQQQEDRVAVATQAHSRAQCESEQSIGEWQAWLIERSIDKSYTPEAMVVLRGSVETGRVELKQAQDMRHRIGAIEHDIQESVARIGPLAKEFGISLATGSPTSVKVAADTLIERYDKVRQSVERRKIARVDAELISQQVERRVTRLAVLKALLEQFLEAGGTQDVEEFRRRAAQQIDRQDLERERQQHNVRLQQLSGPNEQLEEFKIALTQTDSQSLEDRSRDLSAGIDQIRSNQRELLEELGEVKILVGQLASEEESSALRISQNILKEQLLEQAREWSKLALAEELLLRARNKFEEERQPGVIQHAQTFFSSITGERYSRLFAPIGEQTVTVISQSGSTKHPSDLSRGTREQLYLALRFGLIREFGERTESLPVVVDEVLVNFDPERARRAAEAFAELAQTNQVLVFTCHPETVELFLDAAPDAQVIEI